jgi:hypothetical protein
VWMYQPGIVSFSYAPTSQWGAVPRDYLWGVRRSLEGTRVIPTAETN